MHIVPPSRPRPDADTAAFALLLRAGDGSAWPLVFSAGIERFIGAYPRVEGLCREGELLRYARIDRTEQA